MELSIDENYVTEEESVNSDPSKIQRLNGSADQEAESIKKHTQHDDLDIFGM